MNSNISAHDLDCIIQALVDLRKGTYYTERLTGRSYTSGREAEIEKHQSDYAGIQASEVATRLGLDLSTIWDRLRRQNMAKIEKWKNLNSLKPRPDASAD